MDRLRSKSAAGAERLKLKLQAVLNNNRSGTITKLSEFCDLQVGTKVYFNVPRRMRKELWLSILHSRSGSGLDARNRFPELIAKVCAAGCCCCRQRARPRVYVCACMWAGSGGERLGVQGVV